MYGNGAFVGWFYIYLKEASNLAYAFNAIGDSN